MSEAEQFFFNEAIRYARELKLPDAILFLRGLIESTANVEMAHRLRAICISLSESDRQLELIQVGQLKLPMDGAKGGNS